MSNELHSLLVGTRGLSVLHNIQDRTGRPHTLVFNGLKARAWSWPLTPHLVPSLGMTSCMLQFVYLDDADITLSSYSLKRVQFALHGETCFYNFVRSVSWGRWGQWNTCFTLLSPHCSSQTLAITVSPVRHKNNSVNKISEIFTPLHLLRN